MMLDELLPVFFFHESVERSSLSRTSSGEECISIEFDVSVFSSVLRAYSNRLSGTDTTDLSEHAENNKISIMPINNSSVFFITIPPPYQMYLQYFLIKAYYHSYSFSSFFHRNVKT